MSPLDPQVIHRLGWALVHFVWQGAALALVTAAALALLRKRAAALRYLVACAGLAAMLAAPCATVWLAPQAPPSRPPVALEEGRMPEPMVASTSLSQLPGASVAPPLRGEPWALRTAAVLEAVFPQMVVGWLIGVAAISCWHAGGWLRVRRLVWRRVAPAMEQWRQMAADLARRMRVSSPVRLLESAAVRVPTLIGCLRPVILMPASVLTGMAPGEIETILAHELAHVRRWDYLVNLLQTLVEALLFYHPAVWWVSRRIRAEREQCCDDVVVATCGNRVAYARALAALEGSRATAVPALAARGGRLLARIRRILAMESERRSSAGWLAGSAALAGIALAAVAVLAAASGLGAAGGAGAAAPSGEATQSASAGGDRITFVTPGGDAVEFITPGGEEIRMLGADLAAPNALNEATLPRRQEAPAADNRSPTGQRILVEARLIQVPAEAKEKMEASLAKVDPNATSGPGVLTEEQAEMLLDHAAKAKTVKTLATPKVMVAENQQVLVFAGANRPLSLPLVGEAPAAEGMGIRTTILFSSGVKLFVTAAQVPDGQSVTLKAELCVSTLEEKGGKTLLTEARGEVQTAVPLGQWLLVRVPQQESYRLTAISQKDDPASGKISMEVLKEPTPDTGKAPDSIWVLLRPSLAQPADTSDSVSVVDMARIGEPILVDVHDGQVRIRTKHGVLQGSQFTLRLREGRGAGAGAKDPIVLDVRDGAVRMRAGDAEVLARQITIHPDGQVEPLAANGVPQASRAYHGVALDIRQDSADAVRRASPGAGQTAKVLSADAGPVAPAVTQVFELRFASADEVVRILDRILKAGKQTRIVADVRSNCIIVTAPPERMKQIEEFIRQLDQTAKEKAKNGSAP